MYSNLPVQLTSFIGREREIKDLSRLLLNAHFITLTGPGGCGKTRLAIQIAKTVRDSFKDSVWFIDLTPVNDPELIPQIIVTTLGLQPPPNKPAMEVLLDFVIAKQMLFILDNCEHLLEACATFTQEMMCLAPKLSIFATSREALGVTGEILYPVSGLTRPSEKDGLKIKPDLLIQFDAIHFFVERACAISPNFILTSENAESIIEICKRLDGLPLALELASARIHVLTVQQIASRLNDRFALLVSTQRRNLDSRHHTLRAVIDWSYELLSIDEQKFLNRLAVFPIGCTLDMAELICTGQGIEKGDALNLLTSLVDKSLLVSETIGRSQARYRLLETIRAYALEKLGSSSETNQIRNRHLEYFVARSEEAAPKLTESHQKLWLVWLECEHDNIQAALSWSLESGQIESGLRISISLVRFWEIRGYVQEGMYWFERLLAKADERVSPIIHANALAFASFMAMFLGNASTTMAFGKQAVALAEKIGDQGNPILILALASLASGARMEGDHQTSFSIEQREIQLLRDTNGPPFFLGMGLLALGGVAIELGDFITARSALSESLAIAEEAGDDFRIAHALNSLGDLARCEKKYKEARTTYERSVALLRELNAQRDLASILNNLGHTYLHLGDIVRAHGLFRESLTIHQSMHNGIGMAECLIGFAAIAFRHGDPNAGARLLSTITMLGGQRVATFSVWHATQMEYEYYLKLIKGQLTTEDFLEEQAAGFAMSLEKAVSSVLSLPLKSESIAVSPGTADGLTEREWEIAALVGQGRTNGEIAAELVLSKRTVETHISNIFSKLGYSSRAQVIHWAMDHGKIQITN